MSDDNFVTVDIESKKFDNKVTVQNSLWITGCENHLLRMIAGLEASEGHTFQWRRIKSLASDLSSKHQQLYPHLNVERIFAWP